jgi:hypothetical protein
MHEAALLKNILMSASPNGERPIIFLAGDSSLDNKYWFPPLVYRPAENGYDSILDPPAMPP